MESDDVGQVLRVAAEYDDRIVTPDMISAWYQIIGRYDVRDAVAAVIKHYSESTERAMPADIRKLIPAMREERQRQEGRATSARALPSRFEDDPVRDARIRSGRAMAREVLDGISARLAEAYADENPVDLSQVAPEVLERHRNSGRALAAIAEAQANVARVQRIQHDRMARRNIDGSPAWQPSGAEPKGAWWEDPEARERHSLALLAEGGRLHMHCENPSCQWCTGCEHGEEQ